MLLSQKEMTVELEQAGRDRRNRTLRQWLLWCMRGALVSLSLVGHPALARAQGLILAVQPGQQTLRCTVSFERTPNAVSALGFEVVYDPTVWRYSGHFTAAEHAKRLSFFNAHEATPGRVRVGGGAMTGQIEPGSSGELLTLEFHILQPGSGNLHLEHLVDHLAGWPSRVVQQ